MCQVKRKAVVKRRESVIMSTRLQERSTKACKRTGESFPKTKKPTKVSLVAVLKVLTPLSKPAQGNTSLILSEFKN
jgi:hypothetical protein